MLGVEQALNLHNARPCSWLEGFTDGDRLFVAPPIKGWILVTGAGLIQPSKDVDECFRILSNLTSRLGHVQFFSFSRRFHYHAWVKADKGQILRAYAWAGTTLWRQGSPTSAETELKLKCFDYAEPIRSARDEELIEQNVSKIPLLAAYWGLDLNRVQEHFLRKELGVAGQAVPRA